MPYWPVKKNPHPSPNTTALGDETLSPRVFGKGDVMKSPVSMFWIMVRPDNSYVLYLADVVIFQQTCLWFLTRNAVVQLRAFYDLNSCYCPPMLFMIEYDGWLYPPHPRLFPKFDPNVLRELYIDPPPEVVAQWTAEYCHQELMQIEFLQRWQEHVKRNYINDQLYWLHFGKRMAEYLLAPLDTSPPLPDPHTRTVRPQYNQNPSRQGIK